MIELARNYEHDKLLALIENGGRVK
jgi:hypothetical protein